MNFVLAARSRPNRNDGCTAVQIPVVEAHEESSLPGTCDAVGVANTAALQEAIDWVRGELGKENGVAFSKATVPLVTGGSHTFNAVAADRSVVATVMNSSGRTSGGKKPVGKLRGAIAELYFLSLVNAPRRVLVATNDSCLDLLRKELDGALADGLELVHVALPTHLGAAVAAVNKVASDEMSA